MIQGILFDKDGTLLDFNATWLPPYREVSEYLANSVNKPELARDLLSKGGYIEETGGWVRDSLLASGSNQQILDFWSREIGELIEGDRLEQVRKIFAHAGNSYVPAIDSLDSFLLDLKDRGYKLGLATMDDQENAHEMIRRLNLTDTFDFVCGGNSGFGVKPDPGMVNAFCEACEIEKTQVMMVGDSPKDLDMGRNAGVALTVGVLTGAHGRAELVSCGDYVLNNITGLVDLLS